MMLPLAGCGDGGAATGPATLHGAWLGEGTFSARGRSVAVKAQLEILPDGRYRFLILEPAMLMLAGVEEGTWSRDEVTLALTPGTEAEPAEPDAEDAEPSVARMLRPSNAQSVRAKSLAIGDDLSELLLDDHPLTLRFTPNAPATQKLRDAGQL